MSSDGKLVAIAKNLWRFKDVVVEEISSDFKGDVDLNRVFPETKNEIVTPINTMLCRLVDYEDETLAVTEHERLELASKEPEPESPKEEAFFLEKNQKKGGEDGVS